ncbi:MAG: asparaginase [Polaromonas sp.]|nr:MAG: asparaginase [Polaromonas sp.]
MHQKNTVILGTGGTIAGQSVSASDNIGYTAAQVGAAELIAAIPALATSSHLLVEQLAQIDSKDMTFAVWVNLAERVRYFLSRDDVCGIVITHGTDTLEETAYFLQAVLNPVKPVVLTCAMRPATSLVPDGVQNIMDALTVARHTNARGVVAVCAGVVHSALDVQKVHTYQLNAFSSGDCGPVAYVEENALRTLRDWPSQHQLRTLSATDSIAVLAKALSDETWPSVEIVMSYAGANGMLVGALCKADVQGIVVAATGNGTIHQELEAALLKARSQGIEVVRASRCVNGRVLPKLGEFLTDSNGLSPVKARVELMLRLMLLPSAVQA